MNNTHNFIIREASHADASRLRSIYAPYVTDTAVTFEYEIPSVEEFQNRIAKVLESYPYLVAVLDGTIAGYAYASSFHSRAAYAWCAEVSIYLDQDYHKKGIGRLLYQRLEELLKAQQVQNLNACIAYPNPQSIAFHEALGFEMAGHFHRCGFKLNQWYDMVWMEKMIGEHEISPKPFISYSSKPVQ